MSRQAPFRKPTRMNSLLQFLSAFSNLLQTTLFPALEQEVGQLTPPHRALVEALALLQMDGLVEARRRRGRPAHSRANILRAFVAKAVLGLPHTRALLDRLQSDAVLRRICGWESVSRVPDETVFLSLRRVRRHRSAPARACGADPTPLRRAGGRAHQSRFHRHCRSRKGSVEAKNETSASLPEPEKDAGPDDPNRASEFA